MKAFSVTVAALAVGALTLLSSTPAMAAGNAVDPGDSMYAINCGADEVYDFYQLFSVDSTTAFSTAIGTGVGSEGNPCAGQPAYNPSTGMSYYIQRNEEEDDSLASIDVATGVSTTIGGFYYVNDEVPEYMEVDAIAIGADGAAYVLARDGLWSLNLANARAEPIGETIDAYAFAADPVTGKFYAVDSGGDIFEINVATGEPTPIDTLTFPTENHEVYSLQFDGAGTFWIEVDNFEPDAPYYATLWSFTLATVASPVLSGIFTDDPFYTRALLIIPGDAPPKPALAETGAELPMPLIAGAGSFALLGAALLIVRRRTRTTV